MRINSVFDSIFKKEKGNLEIRGSVTIHSPIIAEPICIDLDNDGEQELIIGNQDGDLLVIDQNFKLRWKFKVREDITETERLFLDAKSGFGINSSPLIADLNNDGNKDIIFGTELGKVYALNKDGDMLWQYTTQSAIRGSPTLIRTPTNERLVLVGSMDKYLHILDEKGKLVRKIFVEDSIESTPLHYKDLILVGTTEGFVKAYNFSGRKLWEFKTNGKLTAKPKILVRNGVEQILICSTDNNVYSLNMTGVLNWKYETKGSLYHETIVEDIDGDGFLEIIVGSCDNNVHIISDQGIQKWTYDTNFWILAKPLLFDLDNDGEKEIILGSYDTNIYVLSGKGEYNFEYIPGISGIVTQEGNYSFIPSKEPGQTEGKKIWQMNANDLITGMAKHNDNLVVVTKKGHILWLKHKK